MSVLSTSQLSQLLGWFHPQAEIKVVQMFQVAHPDKTHTQGKKVTLFCGSFMKMLPTDVLPYPIGDDEGRMSFPKSIIGKEDVMTLRQINFSKEKGTSAQLSQNS